MANWFRRTLERMTGATGRRGDAPRIHPRSESAIESTKVDLKELVPDMMTFLGRAAYVQLMQFENLGRLVSTAPTIEAKAALGELASLSLEKYRAISREIERHAGVAAEVMRPFTREIDEFQRRTQGHDWYESLTTSYLTAGFLDDFFERVAAGLPQATAQRVRAELGAESREAELVAILLAATESNGRLSARLALWGRRLVGDTLLVARNTLVLGQDHDSDEARIEPIFSELIAGHTRRMDALGLTA